MSAILVYLNNEKSAILVFQTNPVGVELFCNANTFFCFMKQIWPLVTCEKTPQGGVLPYMGYIGMCRPIGYGF